MSENETPIDRARSQRPKRDRVVTLHGRILGDVVTGRLERNKHRMVNDGLAPDAVFPDIPFAEDFAEERCEYFVAGRNQKYPSINRMGLAVMQAKCEYLRPVPLGFLWKRTGGSRNGKATLGKAVLANALCKTFTDRTGFVVLAADHIRNFKLSYFQVEALLYHELLHFRFDEGNLLTVGHDFEAFGLEVEHYGLWKPDLRLAKEKFDQLELL